MTAQSQPTSSDGALRVAVLDFSAADGQPFTSCVMTMSPLKEAGKQLSDELAARLKLWPSYQVIERGDVAKAAATQRRFRSTDMTVATARELGLRLGVDAIVVGQTDGSTWSGNGHRGASLYASVQMLAVHDGVTLWTIDGLVTDPKEQDRVVSTLATDMSARLFDQLARANLGAHAGATAQVDVPAAAAVAAAGAVLTAADVPSPAGI